jgi:zinc transporter 9
MPGGAKIQVKDREPHVWVGLSLILGFILMYLIDTLPQHTTKSSRPQSLHISLGQFNFNRTSGSNSEPELPPSSADLDHSPHGPRPASTTIGLVIHGVADGIALGASSTASSSNLSFVIFIALMIHKAPAAFGLTSVLLKQGLSKRTARAHLIIFSLAAPVGAIFTFLFIHFLGLASALGGSSSTDFFTGTLLLFSGGTFLYVAMHTMQDNASATASHSSAGTETGMNGYAGVPLNDPYGVPAPAPAKAAPSGLTDALVTVGGMLLPLLTQFGHSH